MDCYSKGGKQGYSKIIKSIINYFKRLKKGQIMSEREQAMQLLKAVPDYKLGYVVAFLQGAAIPEEIPNSETLEAMQELEKGGGEVFEGSAHDFLQMMLED